MVKDTNTKTARVLPQSYEAEQALLGCCMINENVPVVVMTSVDDDDFYFESHKVIFKAMKSIYSRSMPVDFVTVSSELESQNNLEKVGGIEYITNLSNAVPSASNFRHYMEIVKTNSTMRKLIDASQKIIDNSFTENDKNNAVSYAEKLVFDIGQSQEFSHLVPLESSLDEVIALFDLLYKDKNALRGLKTGFHALDKITNGLQKSDLILLAARPSVGKTSFAMNIVLNAALKYDAKCAVFSLEMPKVQLAQRALCSTAVVSMEKALKGELDKTKDWKAIYEANDKLRKAKIYVDDSSLNTPVSILSKCRRLKREYGGLDLVMIDYLQLMSNSGKRADNRQQEVADMTRSLKIAAKELNVPILLLSQLSRAVESRKEGVPQLSDLRESGAIEQDADIVMFLHNPENYTNNEAAREAPIKMINLIIAKHRNGSLGTIKLKFYSEHTTFTDDATAANQSSLESTMPPEFMQKVNEVAASNLQKTDDDIDF